MCEPSTLMMMSLALTGVSSISSFMGQQEDAKNQQAAIDNNYQAQLADLAARQSELDGTALEEKSDVAREALVRKGQLRVATGEAGVSGLVVDSLLNDVQTQAGRSVSRIEENRVRASSQNDRSKQSAHSSAQSQTNAARGPSAASLIGDLGSAGLQIHSQYSTPTKKV